MPLINLPFLKERLYLRNHIIHGNIIKCLHSLLDLTVILQPQDNLASVLAHFVFDEVDGFYVADRGEAVEYFCCLPVFGQASNHNFGWVEVLGAGALIGGCGAGGGSRLVLTLIRKGTRRYKMLARIQVRLLNL